MRTLLRLAAAVGIVLSLPCMAILPESGWYWNPAQSGRGFNIEIQDNLLFVAAFGYDARGEPTWWVAGGGMSSDRSFSANAKEAGIPIAWNLARRVAPSSGWRASGR